MDLKFMSGKTLHLVYAKWLTAFKHSFWPLDCIEYHMICGWRMLQCSR